MKKFYVLFDNGENRPALCLTVFAQSKEQLQDKFPTAIRIMEIGQ